MVKNPPANAGNMGSTLGSGRSPGEGNGYSTPGFFPGESHGQKSLVGYSPRSHKELDTTEQLTHTHISIFRLLIPQGNDSKNT